MNRFSPSKFLFLLIFSIGLSLSASRAQDKQIVKLNEHFYPINENDSINYFYKAITTYLTDSTSLERIFSRKNQIVKITRYGYNEEGDFPEENIETYDTNGKINSKKIKNRNNGFFHAIYYNDGELLGDVLHRGANNYEIRKAENGEITNSEENPFEPQPGFDKNKWENTLIKNLKYPTTARRNGEEGTVMLAIYVNEFGEHTEPVLANPENVSKSIAREALRVVNKYEGEITPAKTIEGNTVDAWLYIPIRFMLD
ncbi:TonB family protein [Algoriphagus sp. Y33]|uniref:TonB family protein n=1 Tax=Algoriphagus sp. Y33 TaxID=2772483 RepID=UPI0017839194|nr:TonB family protein [Algoriphagus sp. Y33]